MEKLLTKSPHVMIVLVCVGFANETVKLETLPQIKCKIYPSEYNEILFKPQILTLSLFLDSVKSKIKIALK